MNIDESNYRCFLAYSGDCKGEVKRILAGTEYLDVCIRHCVLLKNALTDEGF